MIADNETGLLFKNKRDRKVINVDPQVRGDRIITLSADHYLFHHTQAVPGDNTKRSPVKTEEYVQVVIYDHMTRRKS